MALEYPKLIYVETPSSLEYHQIYYSKILKPTNSNFKNNEYLYLINRVTRKAGDSRWPSKHVRWDRRNWTWGLHNHHNHQWKRTIESDSHEALSPLSATFQGLREDSWLGGWPGQRWKTPLELQSLEPGAFRKRVRIVPLETIQLVGIPHEKLKPSQTILNHLKPS